MLGGRKTVPCLVLYAVGVRILDNDVAFFIERKLTLGGIIGAVDKAHVSLEI